MRSKIYCRVAILLNRGHSQIASFSKDALNRAYRLAHGHVFNGHDVLLPEYDSFAKVLDPNPLILGTGDSIDISTLRDRDLLIWEWGWTDTPARTVLRIREQLSIPLLMFPGQLDRYWRELDIRTHATQMEAAACTDAIGVMLEDTASYYQSISPSARVFHMPVPVACDYYSSLAKRTSKKNRNRLLLTAPCRFTGASSQMHIATFLAFRDMRTRLPKLEGLCFVYSSQERRDCEIVLRDLGLSGCVEIQSYLRPIDRYISKIDDCYAGLYLSSGLVQGRLALIAACMGLPMVVGDDIETHRRLFPGTTVKWYDTALATDLSLKLIDDDVFRASVISHARDAVTYYDVDRCRERMIQGITPILRRAHSDRAEFTTATNS